MEIVPLPAVTVVAELPAYIVGVVNRHGCIVPVVDLNMRFGLTRSAYRLEDSLVVAEVEGRPVGFVVDAAVRVRDVPASELEPTPEIREMPIPESRFICGLIRTAEHVVMRLDLKAITLATMGDLTATSAAEAVGPNPPGLNLNASLEAAALFRERAETYAAAGEDEIRADLRTFAVVRLGGEMFGVGLDTVREFALVPRLTPVPCCPPHVAGMMNLRGDLFTVIDVAPALGLPPHRAVAEQRAVMVEHGSIRAAILVDEIVDVLHIEPSRVYAGTDIHRATGSSFIDGAVPYRDSVVTLLDLGALVAQPELIVNEMP